MMTPVWDEQMAKSVFDLVVSLPIPEYAHLNRQELEDGHKQGIYDLLFNTPDSYEYAHAIRGFVTICQNLVHGDPTFKRNVERVKKELKSLAGRDAAFGILWALPIIAYIESL